MRSLARARSSSRRAPPKAASKPCSAIASSSVVVCSRLRDARGPVSSTTRPASIESCTDATISRSPSSATRRSRNSMTSGKLWPVSTCMSGNGKRRRAERLLGQAQQHDRVLAAAEQQHRPLELGGDLAHDVDRLGLERVQVGQLGCGSSMPGHPRPARVGAHDGRATGEERRPPPGRRRSSTAGGRRPAFVSDAERRAEQHAARAPGAGRGRHARHAARLPIQTPGSEPTRMLPIRPKSTLPTTRCASPAAHSRIAAWKTSVPTTRCGVRRKTRISARPISAPEPTEVMPSTKPSDEAEPTAATLARASSAHVSRSRATARQEQRAREDANGDDQQRAGDEHSSVVSKPSP